MTKARVEVVVAHHERATLRVGDVFVKVDSDPARLEREVAVMAMVPVPTAPIMWHNPPALALGVVRGRPLARLGEASSAPAAAWRAAGAAIRALHDTAPPPWEGRNVDGLATKLATECAWLVANDVVAADVVERNRQLAEAVLRPWRRSFIHGDLQVDHVFVDGDEVTAILDWSEGAPGDALLDLATLTVGHPEHLDDVVAGYGEVDRDLIRGWWSLRCLSNIRWLVEAGYGDPQTFPEVAVLRREGGR